MSKNPYLGDRDSQGGVVSCPPFGKGIEQMQAPKERIGSSEQISSKIIVKIPLEGT
jgi:hypothetical protein